MPTGEPTPAALPGESTGNPEMNSVDQAVNTTVMTLTVVEAQDRWDELIDHVIPTVGPVRITSLTGGAVLMSIADYDAWKAQLNLPRPPSKDTDRTDTGIGDQAE